MKRSKAVDSAIRKGWVILANELFKRAKAKVEFNEMAVAEEHMRRLEKWLDHAGARATEWYFRP